MNIAVTFSRFNFISKSCFAEIKKKNNKIVTNNLIQFLQMRICSWQYDVTTSAISHIRVILRKIEMIQTRPKSFKIINTVQLQHFHYK